MKTNGARSEVDYTEKRRESHRGEAGRVADGVVDSKSLRNSRRLIPSV